MYKKNERKVKPIVTPESATRLVAAGILAERGDMLQAAILFCLGLGIKLNQDNIEFASVCLQVSKTKLEQETNHVAQKGARSC